MMLVGVYGAGGCGRGVLPLIRQQLEASSEEAYELVFVDDRPPSSLINGYPCLTYEQYSMHPASVKKMSLAVADGHIREKLAARCVSDGIGFFQAQAVNVVQMDNVEIGEGAILSPFVTLTSNIRIGRHFQANLYSYVEHDCMIGDFVTFAPGVKCNGNILVEDFAYIGTGAIIRQGMPEKPLVIGKGAIVGMGAVVTRDVPAGSTVIGNPARIMEK